MQQSPDRAGSRSTARIGESATYPKALGQRRPSPDKNEGVAKTQRIAPVLGSTSCLPGDVEDQSSEMVTVNHFPVQSLHQPSTRSKKQPPLT